MIRKAQLSFENFAVAFLFLFLLASSVFLFIGGGGGSDIDFFNQTIFSEPMAGVDYAYLTVYEYELGWPFDEYGYNYSSEYTNVTFGFKRTAIPKSLTYPLSAQFYVGWEYCYPENCINKTNQDFQPESLYTIPYAREFSTHYYNYNFTEKNYPDCNSTITLGVFIPDETFNETVLDNNFYTFTINTCFYPPMDTGVNSVCIPLDENLATPCETVREWNGAGIFTPKTCMGCDACYPPGGIWNLFECNNAKVRDNNAEDYTSPEAYLPIETATPRCCTIGYIGKYPVNICNSVICNGYKQTICCDCQEYDCSIPEGNIEEPETPGYNPYDLRIDVSNEYNDIPFRLKIELINTNGEFETLNFNKVKQQIGTILVEHSLTANNYFEINEWNNLTYIFNLEDAKIVFKPVTLQDCENGAARASIEYEKEEHKKYLTNDEGGFIIEYDENNNTILTNPEETIIIFQSEVDTKTVYEINAITPLRVPVYDENGIRLFSEGSAEVTYNKNLISIYRSFDNLPVFRFDADNNLVGEGGNYPPYAEVMNGEQTNCYIPTTYTYTDFNCGELGSYTKEGDWTSSCVYEKRTYDIKCLNEEGIYETISTSMPTCDLPNENCECDTNTQLLTSCACSLNQQTNYEFCTSNLIDKKAVEYYYTVNILNDANLTNNLMEENIHWCVVQ
ncbi:hypothetical protein COS83_00385 [archaeon CG07_land_8_20_14_0_80_38_8]|nr:MAG: hypothetical protein COS83_00385 [archaeon CG07_land_8_20_14_0_80_38_8]PIU89329.1 MAG: hypothetical protein COS64_00905 [archaeon CG06_land_8_20_14_3_00_37_11]